MPLSFASMLGGMCTLIGTSTNLVLNAQVLLTTSSTLYFCLLPTAYCLLPAACCLLPAAYCLLPTTRADLGRPGCAAAAPYHVLDERGGPARGAGGHALPRAAIGSGLGLGLARLGLLTTYEANPKPNLNPKPSSNPTRRALPRGIRAAGLPPHAAALGGRRRRQLRSRRAGGGRGELARARVGRLRARAWRDVAINTPRRPCGGRARGGGCARGGGRWLRFARLAALCPRGDRQLAWSTVLRGSGRDQVGSCGSPGRAWRLWAARYFQGEEGTGHPATACGCSS